MTNAATDSESTPVNGSVLRGHASTRAEHAVEHALDVVNAWEGRSASYSPIHGGLQNENWRVTVEGERNDFFLKVPGAGSEAYIDRGNSHVAAQRAGEIEISPRIVHFDPTSGVEIVEFLDGYRACTNGDMKRAEIASEIIGIYRAFASVAPLPVTKSILDMIEEHREQAARVGVQLPAFWPTLLREYSAARAALEGGGLDLVPCHNDPMPGNFLIADGAPMRLVDFEFASNNERAYELAVMATEFFYDDTRLSECVEEFYGSVEPATLARVQVCSFLADVKWGLWGCLNAHLNTGWDYDYHKYGVWKLRRAQLKMTDPRWGNWLGRL